MESKSANYFAYLLVELVGIKHTQWACYSWLDVREGSADKQLPDEERKKSVINLSENAYTFFPCLNV